jgi:hypothetical protein
MAAWSWHVNPKIFIGRVMKLIKLDGLGQFKSPLPSREFKAPEAYSWDKEEELRCSLSLRWKPIGRVLLDEKGKLRFPIMPEGPGLYRLRLKTSDGIESNYVGQSDSLRRRFFHYRNPGPTQVTNIRLNQLIRDLLSRGGEVSVATAYDVWVRTEQGAARADLNRGSLRRLFENLALAVEQASDIDSLNR